MDMTKQKKSTREELLSEIAEARALVSGEDPLHPDPVEDLTIRGIWEALLESLCAQLEETERLSSPGQAAVVDYPD